MPSNQFALAADDPSLARLIGDRVHAQLGHAPCLIRFDAVQDSLGPEFDGVLVCAARSANDSARVIQLVRDIHLRCWPSTLCVVETAEAARTNALTCLDPYIACRLHWPEEAPTLLNLLRGDSLSAAPACPAPMNLLPERLSGTLVRQLLRQTPSLLALAQPLALAAQHDVTVLLTGETGSGKTHLARLIHEHSTRHAGRLLVVPCGALTPSLVESEFFGHAKGAFTGADQAKIGKFEAVGEGTLLLDEVDTLGLEQQAKLLRVIETGEFEPVGSNDTRQCRARVIAASNLDLEQAVEQGQFRQDLFYRLNVLMLYLPPLRERPRDVACLARDMAARFSSRFGKGLFGISPQAQALLEAFPWPGNIRQLENVMQQAVLMSNGPELLAEHLPPLVRAGGTLPGPSSVSLNVPAAPPAAPCRGLAEDRERHERDIIERALADSGNCRTRAAKALRISRVTLYNKMKKYGLLATSSPPEAS